VLPLSAGGEELLLAARRLTIRGRIAVLAFAGAEAWTTAPLRQDDMLTASYLWGGSRQGCHPHHDGTAGCLE
jgi:hypothetical protein